jgi:hypothetical protein
MDKLYMELLEEEDSQEDTQDGVKSAKTEKAKENLNVDGDKKQEEER